MKVALAKKINQASGGVVIAPWEVDLLAREWQMVFRGLHDTLPALKKIESQVEKILAEKRRKHPN